MTKNDKPPVGPQYPTSRGRHNSLESHIADLRHCAYRNHSNVMDTIELLQAQAAEIEKLEADNASKTKLLRAICDDMECVSGCDEHAHDWLCPVANEGQAFVLLRERIAELERERDGWKQRALGWNQEATDNEIARAEAADELTTLRERVKRVPHISRSGVAFWEPLLETVELQSMNQNHDAGRCAAHGGACLFIEPEPEGASDVSSSPQGGGIEARQKPSLPTCSNCGEALCPRKERCQNTNHVHGTAAHHIKDGGTANDACKREWCHLCRGTGKLLSMEDCQQKPLPAIPTGECDRCKGTGWITPLSPGPLEAP